MSKVKGVEEEEWKHAIDPLMQADLRVEEGEPQGSVSVFLPNTTQTKTFMILSTGSMLFTHAANSDKPNRNDNK